MVHLPCIVPGDLGYRGTPQSGGMEESGEENRFEDVGENLSANPQVNKRLYALIEAKKATTSQSQVDA